MRSPDGLIMHLNALMPPAMRRWLVTLARNRSLQVAMGGPRPRAPRLRTLVSPLSQSF